MVAAEGEWLGAMAKRFMWPSWAGPALDAATLRHGRCTQCGRSSAGEAQDRGLKAEGYSCLFWPETSGTGMAAEINETDSNGSYCNGRFQRANPEACKPAGPKLAAYEPDLRPLEAEQPSRGDSA